VGRVGRPGRVGSGDCVGSADCVGRGDCVGCADGETGAVAALISRSAAADSVVPVVVSVAVTLTW
jgi:hypothetical protein